MWSDSEFSWLSDDDVQHNNAEAITHDLNATKTHYRAKWDKYSTVGVGSSLGSWHQRLQHYVPSPRSTKTPRKLPPMKLLDSGAPRLAGASLGCGWASLQREDSSLALAVLDPLADGLSAWCARDLHDVVHNNVSIQHELQSATDRSDTWERLAQATFDELEPAPADVSLDIYLQQSPQHTVASFARAYPNLIRDSDYATAIAHSQHPWRGSSATQLPSTGVATFSPPRCGRTRRRTARPPPLKLPSV